MSNSKGIIAQVKSEYERLAQRAVRAIAQRIEAEGRDIFIKAELHLTGALSSRAAEDNNRFSKIKTLLTDGKLVDIDTIYVKQNIKLGKSVLPETDFQSQITQARRIVATGLAGTGKSLLLRQLFRHLCGATSTVYPIFIELRHLKGANNPSLLSFAADQLSNRKNKLTVDHIEIAMDEGPIALLLDGFDEIDFDVRDKYQEELLLLAERYPKAPIVITSRNDPQRFRSWSDFNEAEVLPLSPAQTIELINKIDEDAELKTRFIAKAKSSLFKTHATFLQNPLLAGMMLITFKRVADISVKEHIFYREAFSALYDRHDASKAGRGGPYSRRRYAVMDIDNFTSALSVFSFLSYAERAISMDEKQALNLIEESFKYLDEPSNPKDYLKDLLESVCVLMGDGDQITYTHRSFQEYFCAQFLAESRTENQYEIINSMLSMSFTDNVMRLFMAINQEAFERQWAIPILSELLTINRSDSADPKGSSLLFKCFGRIGLRDDQIEGIGEISHYGAAFVVLTQCYRKRISLFRFKLGPTKKRASTKSVKTKPQKRHTNQRELTALTRETLGQVKGATEWAARWSQKFEEEAQSLLSELENKYSQREASMRDLLRSAQNRQKDDRLRN